MRKVNYLVGNSKFSLDPFEPFSKDVCNFLNNLSNELNSVKNIKNYPDLKALSFWCRSKNILKLKNNFNSEKNRVGLGMIFHVTPANIPTNFAYSLIFGLLTGNSNVVKVPSKNFEQINTISSVIKKILKKKNSFLKNKITIIQYKNNNEFTKKISSLCNARVIWGGDQTINSLRDFKIKERAIDITFADRYSFCVMNPLKIERMSDFELKNLVQRFYNDTYLVDQNACSSPHLIVWLGRKSKNFKERFWEKLYNLVKTKYKFTESAPIEKYTDLCKYALSIGNIKSVETFENLIYKIKLKKIDKNNHDHRGKWGLFFEYDLKNLNEIKHIVNNKYQTLTYYGIDKFLLKKFVLQNNLKGIDRIVPVGQSLNIGLLWDGYDIVNILSRGIEVR